MRPLCDSCAFWSVHRTPALRMTLKITFSKSGRSESLSKIFELANSARGVKTRKVVGPYSQIVTKQIVREVVGKAKLKNYEA